MRRARAINRLNENSTGLSDLLRARGEAVEGVPEFETGSVPVDSTIQPNESAQTERQEKDTSEQSIDEPSDWPIWKLLHGTENLEPASNNDEDRSAPVQQVSATVGDLTKAAMRIVNRSRARIFEIVGDDRIFQKTAMLAASSAVLLLLLTTTVQRFSTSPNSLRRREREESKAAPLQGKTSLSEASTAESDLGFNVTESAAKIKFQSNAPFSRLHKSSRNVRSGSIAKDTVTSYEPVSESSPSGDQSMLPPVAAPLDLKSN